MDRRHNYLPEQGVVIGYPSGQFYENEYGGKLPIGSMKERKKEKRKRNLLYITRMMFIMGAVGLLAIAVLRFTAVNTPSVQDAVLNLFYLFFGAIMILT